MVNHFRFHVVRPRTDEGRRTKNEGRFRYTLVKCALRLHAGANPVEIRLRPVRRDDDDEFGKFVAVQFEKPRSEGLDAILDGLDDDLHFDVALHGALPSVERRHRRQNVHARRETFVDERARDRLAEFADRHGRQHEYDGF